MTKDQKLDAIADAKVKLTAVLDSTRDAEARAHLELALSECGQAQDAIDAAAV